MRTPKSMLILAILIVLFSATIARTFAAPRTGIWYVAPPPAGNDGNDCATPTSPCATINAALNKPGFVPGDTVRVAVGTYTGTGDQVVLLNKSATLSGGWNSAFTAQTGMSTIDGEGARRGIDVSSSIVGDRLVVQNCIRGGIGVGYSGVLTLTHSAVLNNTAGDACCFGGGGGAGIFNVGWVALVNSNVSNNRLLGGFQGSGIYNLGALILDNTTLSGNINGEGVYNLIGSVHINNSTIANNERSGIWNQAGSITLQNTILSGNGNTYLPDCNNDTGYGVNRVISLGYNIIQKNQDCTLLANDLTNINSNIGALQDNGGPTYTHALLAISPAINAGNPAGCTGSTGLLATDQRGFPRVGRCDIGAYEDQNPFSVEKRADKSVTFPGDSLTYQVVLNNYGTMAVNSILVTDTLPTHLTYINNSLTATGGSYGYSNRVIAWNGSVNANSSVTITFSATVDSTAPLGTTIVNSATINGGGNIVTRIAASGIQSRFASASKTVDRSTISYNFPLSYTINFKMKDTAPATSVYVTDTLPTSLSYVPNSLTATSGIASYANGIVTWSGAASAGENVTITFGATVNPSVPIGTSIVNSATISGSGETFTPTAHTTVVSRVAYVNKGANKGEATSGTPVQYVVTFRMSDAVGATPMFVTDTLPSGLTYINNSLTATSGIANYSNGTITWNGVTSANETVIITFDTAISPSVPIGTSVVNSATIRGAEEMFTPTAQFNVVSRFYSASKTANKSKLSPGESVQYTIRLMLHYSANATTVFVTDTIPSPFTYVNNSLTASSGNPSYNNGTIFWNGLANPYEVVTIRFDATSSPTMSGGTFVNTTNINADGEIVTPSASITVARETFLPMLVKAPGRIVGWVTYNGGAASGIPLELRFYNGSAWSPAASTTTDSTGYFAFVNQPSLAPGQAYYVRYLNSGISQHLSFWNTRALTSYTSGDYVEIGRFDLANITLTSPTHNSTIGLPWQFEWNMRPNTPSDSYEFNVFDYTDWSPWWWSPPQGYRGNYTLNGIPPGFSPNTEYCWTIGVYSPDGGYGMPYYCFAVRFQNPGSAPRLGDAPLRPKNVLRDLPLPPVRKRP